VATLDTLRRPLRNLRLSVTDRCNLRCSYCMPEENYTWLHAREILSFEEISALVDRFIALGVDKVRLTGGEPLVRRDLDVLVKLLAPKPGLKDLALTTNGVLLAQQAQRLREAGLQRLTVSLDTLSATTFHQLTRRHEHAMVLEGIAAARLARFPGGLKLDTVVMRGVNDHELVDLLDYAAAYEAELRFIEYMDVGGATRWSMEHVVSRQQILDALAAKLGPIEPIAESSTAPAERFRLSDGRTFGIIASTTAPFCRTCDRSRLTADGHWFTCLYAAKGLDLKTPLRAGAAPEVLEKLLADTWTTRADRGAEERLALRGLRGPLKTANEMRAEPLLEMHTRGG